MINLKYENQLIKELEEDGTNRRFYERIKGDNKFIPMGLEKKINIYWFQHFFYWDELDHFSFRGNFYGDWLLVPFPSSKRITLNDQCERELKQESYNWYELVQFINDMVIEGERFHDIGITGMEEWDGETISIGWSS